MMVSSGSNAVRVRDKYTSRACNECQRRKRRCSGEKPCRNCRHWGTECVFSEPRGSKVWRASTLNVMSTHWASAENRNMPGSNLGTAPAKEKAIGQGVLDTQILETNGNDADQMAERAVPTSQNGQQRLPPVPSPNAQYSGDNSGQTPQSTVDSELPSPRESVFERNTNFMTSTAFFQQIDSLDRSMMQAQLTNPAQVCVLGTPMLGQNITLADVYRDFDQTVEQVRVEDATKIHTALDIFFANVQPHYPCINEAHLRAQFSAFIANDSSFLTKSGSVQLAALLNFIMAVVKILAGVSVQDDRLLGWEEFCRGEKLLSHAAWLEKANIITIQTLLVKTLYFTYAALLNSAYDTMGTMVRLCFQLGLHNEPSWGEDCKFYDRTYRQRVFWSVFCLNHNVAQTRGVPELLRESDLNVGLPKCVDDRMLYPDCPSLPEMPRTCPVPYLLETIKLTKLSSEVWEAMFGVRAKKPVSQDLIAAMDSKVIELSREIPSFLRWSPNSQQIHEGAPLFIQEQAFILHLRILYLRILLRREDMINFTYGKKTAQLCIDITTEVVAAVEASNASQRRNRCCRHAYLHHLTGAIVPMICIIVRQNNGEDLTRPAINLLNRSLKIMESFSQGSFLARRILLQLRRPIQVARDTIESQRPQNVWSGTTSKALASGVGPTQNALWNGNNVNANNDWELPMPNTYQDPFQDALQKPPELPFLWDDTGADLWNNFNCAG